MRAFLAGTLVMLSLGSALARHVGATYARSPATNVRLASRGVALGLYGRLEPAASRQSHRFLLSMPWQEDTPTQLQARGNAGGGSGLRQLVRRGGAIWPEAVRSGRLSRDVETGAVDSDTESSTSSDTAKSQASSSATTSEPSSPRARMRSLRTESRPPPRESKARHGSDKLSPVPIMDLSEPRLSDRKTILMDYMEAGKLPWLYSHIHSRTPNPVKWAFKRGKHPCQ